MSDNGVINFMMDMILVDLMINQMTYSMVRELKLQMVHTEEASDLVI